MKVSFLVTYYNQKEYVKQSLDSILDIEKPCDWEILVGDDGSSDGTIETVQEYIDKYPDNISIHIMPREHGKKYDSVKRASANRLNILAKSTGDIFCTLDGDDFYCDIKFINEAIEIFEKESDVSVVAFGYKYIQNGVFGEDCTLPADASNQRINKTEYLEKFYLPAGGCVHRKCFSNKRVDYIKSLGYFDDNNIVVNSLHYGEMFAINRPIYAYRQTGQSVYTSMNILEQAILNVQGMDVDLRLVEKSINESIMKRYSSALTMMYIWRKQLKIVLGEEKCKKYLEGCSSLKPSYCASLLRLDDLGSDELKQIKKLMMDKKRVTIEQYIKYVLRGILK